MRTVSPSPLRTRTPPIAGACMLSNSCRLARFDLRPRREGPPGRPNAPWVPPRRPPPGRPPGPRKPPPPPGGPPERPPPGPPPLRPPPPRPPPGPPRPPPGPPRPPSEGADCFGIIAGLGRGIPGAPDRLLGRSPRRVSPPSRAAGRDGIELGEGRPGRCMPWVDEKGLLPGRTPPGRGDGRALPGVARGVGRGVGVGAGVGAASTGGATGSASTCSATVGSSATCAGFSSAFLAGAFLAADFFAGAFLAADFLAPSVLAPSAFAPSALTWSANLASSLRTTGASTVEEADRTNSPMSLRVDKTVLLGTPNFFASS